MNRCKVAGILALAGLILLCVVAGAVFYTNATVNASMTGFPDALNSLPSDCQFVFGVNVQKIVTSPLYVKSKEKQSALLGKALPEFIKETGMDPERDIEYLLGAGRAGIDGKGEGVVIASGSFNRHAITEYLRSKAAAKEMAYGRSTILVMPDRQGKAPDQTIAFLNEQEVAAGNLEAVKKVIRIRENKRKSASLNPAMAALVPDINPEDMFWFAGDAAAAFANSPIKTPLGGAPLGSNASSLRGIAGSFNLTEAFIGKITAVAVDAPSAGKMAEVARGFVALGQMSGDKNPDLKLLLSGLTISQDADRIHINFNFPAALLRQLAESRVQRSLGANGN